MKANPICDWIITLRGRARTHILLANYRGTIDDALAEADALECEVRWRVRSVELRAIERRPALRS